MTLISSYPTITSYAAIDNTNLINDQQWRALAQMSLRSKLTIEELLHGFYIEPVDAERSDAVNLLGRIHCGPNYHLAGCIHHTGSIHT